MPSSLCMRLVLVALLLLASGPGRAEPPCPKPPALLDPPPLAAAIVRALREANRLRIVALGSSSTEGTGASRPEHAWPARLEAILDARFPKDEVEVVNRGKGGETAAQNLARLEADVIRLAPDLVIWQVGTNDALQGLEPELVAARVREGIRRLRALGIEVILMDSQWLPDPGRDERVERMSAVLAGVAVEEGVAIFPRHELMEAWVETGALPPEALIGPDGLHMTDESYRCVAERLSDLFPATLAAEEATPADQQE
ncbi:MAG: SGNH/GDSL hydrolase family protein [Geminicoccaceae bacterium]|nr:SGNH/GDSL hydrolase family protein [Geminicoccaceae bacterium]MCX8100962.1 SGNH/GDSL hydrolase family protein [Geminicoccaceae bacterium]MDW8371210.1 SGNH/GDSL hydrolase family protein [Geminicoccaceae bacterium]